jgi:hypothetical protein
MTSKQIEDWADTKGSASGRLLTRRNTLKGGLALGAGAFGIIGRAAAAPVTMRFGSDSPIDAAHTKSAVVFKDQVERGTPTGVCKSRSSGTISSAAMGRGPIPSRPGRSMPSSPT